MFIILFLSHYNSTVCAILYPSRRLTWREYVPDSNPHLDTALRQFFSLIPETIPDRFREAAGDFTRDRRLPFSRLVSFILSSTASDKNCGLNIKIGEFTKLARRSGLLPNAEAFDPGAVSKARAKVPWEAFQDIFQNAVDLASLLWDAQEWHYWHSMSVYAIDGSKFTLPASETIRQ